MLTRTMLNTRIGARVASAWLVYLAWGLLCLAWGCEAGLPAGEEQYSELNWTDMADQPKIKPQRGDLFGTWPTGSLAPPPGSVAIDQTPYPFTQAQADEAGYSLRNPLEASPEIVARGEWVYTNLCIVCHGPKGAGDGHLTRVFPAPPSLMRAKVRNYSDARIFHVPMRGQGSMPAYARQLEPNEVWSAVRYIRKLQSELPVAPPTAQDKKEEGAR